MFRGLATTAASIDLESCISLLLNASHMMLSYPALMCGYRVVDEALRQPAIAACLDAFMDKDVIPLLKGPDGVSLEDYKAGWERRGK